jgi:hypothetical protein
MNGIINYQTSLGTQIMIRSVEVKPKNSALIKLIYVDSFAVVEKHNIVMDGDDYLAWGNDDDYLGYFVCQKLLGNVARIIKDGEEYTPPTSNIVLQDDNRSVHNEADIQRIQTLQEQLDEQKKKLETIMGLLVKSGSI